MIPDVGILHVRASGRSPLHGFQFLCEQSKEQK